MIQLQHQINVAPMIMIPFRIYSLFSTFIDMTSLKTLNTLPLFQLEHRRESNIKETKFLFRVQRHNSH